MAMTKATLTAGATCAVSGTYPPQGVTGALSNSRVTQTAPVDVTTLTFGTAGGQIDLITCSDRVLDAAGGGAPSLTADLYTGADLKDLAGLTCAFRKVKFVQVSIVSGGDAAGVRVGGAGSNTWGAFFADATDKALIFPGGPPFVGGSPAGVAVGSSTKNLLVENLGAVAVTVRVVIGGTSV